ncbi:MAG: hypothetical protein ACOY0T_38140 [Myxococcota bacterium]
MLSRRILQPGVGGVLSRRQFGAISALFLCACRGSANPTDPPWGKQACANCRMLVSDPRFAAQALSPVGERVYFDDIGCLVSYLADKPGVKKSWVRDANGTWLEAASARYRGGATTPMDFGISVDAGGPLDFGAVKALVAAKTRGAS